MKDEAVLYDKINYRSILTVQDVFSRYLWLRPLERKKSSIVAHELAKIYREHGPPQILQCDNGGRTILKVKARSSEAIEPSGRKYGMTF